MPEVRLIDANALIKDIAESIRFADEWEKESYEKEDKCGLKCAIDTRRSLMAMISRVKEAPTIEAEPVRHGRWNDKPDEYSGTCIIRHCSECGWSVFKANPLYDFGHWNYCPNCGAEMYGGADNGT